MAASASMMSSSICTLRSLKPRYCARKIGDWSSEPLPISGLETVSRFISSRFSRTSFSNFCFKSLYRLICSLVFASMILRAFSRYALTRALTMVGPSLGDCEFIETTISWVRGGM